MWRFKPKQCHRIHGNSTQCSHCSKERLCCKMQYVVIFVVITADIKMNAIWDKDFWPVNPTHYNLVLREDIDWQVEAIQKSTRQQYARHRYRSGVDIKVNETIMPSSSLSIISIIKTWMEIVHQGKNGKQWHLFELCASPPKGAVYQEATKPGPK